MLRDTSKCIVTALMEISGGLTFTRFAHKFTLPQNVKLSDIIRYNIQSCMRHYLEYQEFFAVQ